MFTFQNIIGYEVYVICSWKHFMLDWIVLGAIQIIRDTFWAYFNPTPSSMCHLVTLARPSPRCDVTIFILQKT